MKIPSRPFRAAIAVAAVAILAAAVSGIGSAAADGPVPDPGAVAVSDPGAPPIPDPAALPAPYPYPGTVPDLGALVIPDPAALPAPYPYPGTVPDSTSAPTLLACRPVAAGDYVHKSSGAVSGHGWWTRGTCPNQKAEVTIYLYEYYEDGTWRLKDSNSGSVWPGGGSANRVTVRRNCDNANIAGWYTNVRVAIGEGDRYNTPSQNLACWVLT